jgi:peptide/nickel transport system permease protein
MGRLPRRATRYLLAFFFITTVNFIVPRAMPGDPVLNLLGEDYLISQQQVAELRAELGLDRPLTIQYLKYWQDVLRLDFGYSYHFNQDITSLVAGRMGWTLLLVGPAILLGAVFGGFLGSLAGWHSGRPREKAATSLALMFYATPPYFLALLLLYAFAVQLEWFPLKGFYTTGTWADILKHLTLPVCALSLFSTSRNFMIMRGSVLLEKKRLYVNYARAKGLLGASVLFKHVFQNASPPLVTLIALDFGFIFSGALFVEIIFSMNGMGTLIFDALMSRDYPVLQGSFLVIMFMVIAANFFADLLYGWIDPRVRVGDTSA